MKIVIGIRINPKSAKKTMIIIL